MVDRVKSRQEINCELSILNREILLDAGWGRTEVIIGTPSLREIDIKIAKQIEDIKLKVKELHQINSSS